MTEQRDPTGGPAPEQGLRPTRPAALIVAALAAAAVGWLLLSVLYNEMPALPWLPTLTVAVLAVLEGLLAQNTRSRIERRPGQPGVDPLAVAKFAVLAKASSLSGAIFAGFCAGLLVWLLLEPTRAAWEDVPAAAGGLVASLGLVGAALLLERACRVPEQPEDDDDRGVPGRS